MPDLSLPEVLGTYRARIETVIERLQAAYGQVSPGRVLEEAVPAAGDLESLRFWFHGTGCTALFEGYLLAWDWDDGGALVFDAWKLWQMTRDHPLEFGHWSELAVLRGGLEQLVVDGQLTQAQGWQGFNLPGKSAGNTPSAVDFN